MRRYSKRNRSDLDPLDYSCSLLSRKDYSEFELKSKLLEHFDEKSVDAAIEELIDRGLLSDERYVDRIIRKYAFEKKYGYLKVEYELIKRGLNKKIFSGKLKELLTDEVEKEMAKSLLNKKPRDKIRTYLLSRGYRPHIVQEVLADNN